MTVGLGLLAIAAGAILKFAVTTRVSGIDLGTVGVILMVVGALGVALTLGAFVTGGRSEDRSI